MRAVVVDRDDERADQDGQDGVVDHARKHGLDRIRDRERRTESTKSHEQHHRIQQTQDRDRDDRRDRSDPGEHSSEDERTAHAEQKREGCRPEWSLCQDIKCQPADEGPYEASFESDGDREHDTQHEHEVRLGATDPEIRAHGQLEQGRPRRADRSE